MRILFGLALALAVATAGSPGAIAQTFPPSVHPCPHDPAFHALDFWVGQWVVRNGRGTEVGHSRIESILDGCAIREQWSAVNGGRGESLTSYDPATKRWRQHWIETDGTQSDYVGGLDGNDVVMIAADVDAAGKPVQHRMRFSLLADGRVHQFMDDSSDGGRSWTVSFDGYYSKVPS